MNGPQLLLDRTRSRVLFTKEALAESRLRISESGVLWCRHTRWSFAQAQGRAGETGMTFSFRDAKSSGEGQLNRDQGPSQIFSERPIVDQPALILWRIEVCGYRPQHREPASSLPVFFTARVGASSYLMSESMLFNSGNGTYPVRHSTAGLRGDAFSAVTAQAPKGRLAGALGAFLEAAAQAAQPDSRNISKS